MGLGFIIIESVEEVQRNLCFESFGVDMWSMSLFIFGVVNFFELIETM
jgi:hypothetical protein